MVVVDPEEMVRVARSDLAFFSNEHKLARERWVVDRWLLARGVVDADVRPGGDPPDFIVDGCGVEVVELLEPGRRRGDDYRAKLEAAEEGHALARPLVSRTRVVERGHEWVVRAIEGKAEKYEPLRSSAWTLLIYVNIPWADCLSCAHVEAGIEALQPPFAAIEVVFEVGTGPMAATLWRRSG
jgi:hypothetical protein